MGRMHNILSVGNRDGLRVRSPLRQALWP
jgi:hypothetical protein